MKNLQSILDGNESSEPEVDTRKSSGPKVDTRKSSESYVDRIQQSSTNLSDVQVKDRLEYFTRIQEVYTMNGLCKLKQDSKQLLKEISQQFPLPTVDAVHNEKVSVDYNACELIPPDVEEGYIPVITGSDGNCLPRVFSRFVFKTSSIQLSNVIKCSKYIEKLLNSSTEQCFTADRWHASSFPALRRAPARRAWDAP